MKSIDDPSLFNLSELAAELTNSFDKIWNELDELDGAGTDLDDYSKVRLGCTGELVHIGSIVLVGVRAAPREGGLIEFTCPRCRQNHESPLLHCSPRFI